MFVQNSSCVSLWLFQGRASYSFAAQAVKVLWLMNKYWSPKGLLFFPGVKGILCSGCIKLSLAGQALLVKES